MVRLWKKKKEAEGIFICIMIKMKLFINCNYISFEISASQACKIDN